ncbi:hypothetical protein [Geomesophilobacter sediminis]|uniref:Uncharacterized protein n=1 Tax=Geomesophilobacter sediminis TaxID=2798584 RepID=A0A8J7J544_9BACT|nr:hypothetical protein [Geomesophilobacter sediminis]MBJ6723446.1 hypothetical protein [Geomesophilobacter sediminis]
MSKITCPDDATKVGTTLDRQDTKAGPTADPFVKDNAQLLDYLSAILTSPQPKINLNDIPFDYTPEETTPTGNPIVDGVIHFGSQQTRSDNRRLKAENDALKMKVARLTAQLNEAECTLDAVLSENDELKVIVARLQSQLEAPRAIRHAEREVVVPAVAEEIVELVPEAAAGPIEPVLEAAVPAPEAVALEEPLELVEEAPEAGEEVLEPDAEELFPETFTVAELMPKLMPEPVPEPAREPDLAAEPAPAAGAFALAAEVPEPIVAVASETVPESGGDFFAPGAALAGAHFRFENPPTETEPGDTRQTAAIHIGGEPIAAAPISVPLPPEADARPAVEVKIVAEAPAPRVLVPPPPQPEPTPELKAEPKPERKPEPKPELKPKEPAPRPAPKLVAPIPPRPKNPRVIRIEDAPPAEPGAKPAAPKPVFQPFIEEKPAPAPEEATPEPVVQPAATEPEPPSLQLPDGGEEPDIEPAPVTKVVAKKHIDNYRQIQQEAEAGEAGASHDIIGKA